MSFSDILRRQEEWSLGTFGPGHRTKALLAHIRKELQEIEDEPLDLEEWVDVMILAADGALRAGATPTMVSIAYTAKLTKNMEREWPDWRTSDPDRPIEHVRD